LKRLGSRYRFGRSPDGFKFKSPEASAVHRRARRGDDRLLRPDIEGRGIGYEVGADVQVVGRISMFSSSPAGTPWLWSLYFTLHENREVIWASRPREAAIKAFARRTKTPVLALAAELVQTAFTIAMLPRLREENTLEKNNDDQVNCCRRLSRGRRNFGAGDNPGIASSAGWHALASSFRVRPV
jgi:hypothetical protein